MKTICIAGKNNIAVNTLNFLLTSYGCEFDFVGICNQDDTGIDAFQQSFKKTLQKNNVKEVKLDDVYQLKNLIFLSLEFDKIIKIEKFESTELFNVHFSLLPKYRGMYTSCWPILNNDDKTGVTLHKIDNGIDTGDIIDQIEYEINDNMTSKDIYLKNIFYGTEIVKKNLNKLVDGSYPTKKQDNTKSSYYDKNSIDFNNLKIYFNEPDEIIKRKIRAFDFPEYQIPVYLPDKIVYTKNR